MEKSGVAPLSQNANSQNPILPQAFPNVGLESRQLLELMPAAAYLCDADGLITYYNRHAVEVWGRAPALNDSIDRFCGSFKLFSTEGEPLDHSQCWMALALRTGQEYNGKEIIIERPDGSRLTALAHANPIWDESGKIAGAINVLVDISDRKRGEEAQARLAAIVESSDDAIVSKTLDGRITSWNRGAERLFGYTAEEIVGQSIKTLIPPERYDEEDLILSRLRRGERVEHFETVRIDKHGRRLDISVTISPMRDGSGRIVGASKVARDVTSRKQEERMLVALKDELATQVSDLRRLHEMSTRLSATLDLRAILEEVLRTAVVIEGTDLGVLSLCEADEERLEIGASVGIDEESLKLIAGIPAGGGACGASFQERRRVVVEDTETDAVFQEHRDTARRAGFRAVHSTPLVTRQGKAVGVLSTYFRRPHLSSEREMRLIDLCVRHAVDFIENARLYAQLREADERKDEFLAMLAHELRNPLAPISSALQILRLSDDVSPAVEHVREIMERQVNHMVRLVDDLLEVSRITRGKIELRKEPVSLVSIVGNAVETSRPLIEGGGHQLAITLAPDPMMLEADPVRLAQVVSNLLNNAAKYTEADGQIWLTATTEDGQAVISVRDTGVGIPVEMLPRVFDMFAQVDRTLNRAQGGLGIGLTLARNLVQLHGGRIEARSKGLGQGSEFIVRLPLAAKAVPLTAPAPIVAPSRAPLPPRRVLVVDDTRAAAYTLGKLLERMGQQVHVAHDAAAALDTARSVRPEVVISDIAMPRMDGYELARRLRQEPGMDNLVLIASTGYGQDRDRDRAKAAGFDFHLVKPIGFQSLYDLLASLPRRSADAVFNDAR